MQNDIKQKYLDLRLLDSLWIQEQLSDDKQMIGHTLYFTGERDRIISELVARVKHDYTNYCHLPSLHSNLMYLDWRIVAMNQFIPCDASISNRFADERKRELNALLDHVQKHGWFHDPINTGEKLQTHQETYGHQTTQTILY